MIPRKIHYCWFGGKELPEFAKKCIDSWKKYMPDYEIIEWNESNYDVRKNLYMSQAYDAKKYAFVSDYARFDILYQQGGVYFDTDVEVLKSVEPLCEEGNWCGTENKGAIAAGLGIASEAEQPVLKQILESYEKSSFYKENGDLNLTTVVERLTDIFRLYGFKDEEIIQKVAGFTVYPKEYFCPKDVQSGILSLTPNTYTIHHFDASWCEDWQKETQKFRYSVMSKIGKNFFALFICNMNHVFLAIKNLGFKKGLEYCKNKLNPK